MGTLSAWLTMEPQAAGEAAQAIIDHAMNCEPGLDERPLLASQLAGETLYEQDDFAMTSEAFWFQTSGGVQFSYQLGGSVRANLPSEALREEFDLFLWGTVYGAVAWFNAMVPLHASSVVLAHDRDAGEVGQFLPHAVAFSGDSGSGKSTIAAGLTAGGARQLCDDTLVVVPCQGGLVALPDRKPLKLWEDSLELLRFAPSGAIKALPGKSFAEPKRRQETPCLLTDLYVLGAGEDVEVEPILGQAKLERLIDAFYRSAIHFKRTGHRAHGELMTSLASGMRMWRLKRPCDKMHFARELGEIEARLRARDSDI